MATRVAPANHPTLIFIRHGETDWNAEERLQGQQDIPLNDRGRGQATRNGEVLRDIDGIAAFDFVASPLGRALESMRLLRSGLGLPPDGFRVDPQITEITFGAWEGFTLAELAQNTPEDVRLRQADKWGYVPPNGESYAMLMPRIRAWLDGLTEDTVAVSHGAVMRVVQGLLLDIDPQEVPVLPTPQDRALVWRGDSVSWL